MKLQLKFNQSRINLAHFKNFNCILSENNLVFNLVPLEYLENFTKTEYYKYFIGHIVTE